MVLLSIFRHLLLVSNWLLLYLILPYILVRLLLIRLSIFSLSIFIFHCFLRKFLVTIFRVTFLVLLFSWTILILFRLWRTNLRFFRSISLNRLLLLCGLFNGVFRALWFFHTDRGSFALLLLVLLAKSYQDVIDLLLWHVLLLVISFPLKLSFLLFLCFASFLNFLYLGNLFWHFLNFFLYWFYFNLL